MCLAISHISPKMQATIPLTQAMIVQGRGASADAMQAAQTRSTQRKNPMNRRRSASGLNFVKRFN